MNEVTKQQDLKQDYREEMKQTILSIAGRPGLYKLVMRSDKPQAKPFGQCLFLRPDRQCRFAALRHR